MRDAIVKITSSYLRMVGWDKAQSVFRIIRSFSDYLRDTADTWIREHIAFIMAGTGKFGDNGSLVTSLKPMKGILRNCILLSRVEGDLMKYGVIGFTPNRRMTVNNRCTISLHI
jgi:hypothetical protein